MLMHSGVCRLTVNPSTLELFIMVRVEPGCQLYVHWFDLPTFWSLPMKLNSGLADPSQIYLCTKKTLLYLLSHIKVLLHKVIILHSIHDDYLFHVRCSCRLVQIALFLDSSFYRHHGVPNQIYLIRYNRILFFNVGKQAGELQVLHLEQLIQGGKM
ncbi:hypothetical protein POTOM_033382 [Populus tomentosa]|uniref:Uncharacterized protein n=1 Tax=Populus tomentosa TaxID=118781 RepID=A0A8X7Z5P6_POPTO|nr:hypothetical protein POTOM_033382 [Populus tomentosa]